MPRNFRRFFASIFLVLVSIFIANAQTTADVMRERITKAKAYIAVKNYNAAIYELENIRRETSDATVHSVVNILLMNSYLEQADYKRAQDFLTELSKSNKTGYTTVAAQVVRGARTQLERYKSLGLSVSDRNLPLEAAADIEKMRQTLELVIEQSKVLGKDKSQTSNAMALLEEASNARSSLAKDDYDANRWKNESADARETLANSRSVVLNADGTTNTSVQNTVATNNNPVITNQTTTTNPILNPVTTQTNNNPVTTNNTVAVKETPKIIETQQTNPQTNNTNTESNDSANRVRDRKVENNNPQTTTTTTTVATNDNSLPLDVGLLIEYATQKVNPTYPQQARTIRQTGIVKVELIIDEEGKVAEVKKTSGPSLLQGAAKDAAKKWRFKPFMRDGQPVKATGFISFNFNL